MVKTCSERGAAAVEFALVAPFLLALLLGIVEFGFAFNTQISLTQAAREAARTMAITNDPVSTRDGLRTMTPLVNSKIDDADIKIYSKSLSDPTAVSLTDACKPGYQVTVSIEHAHRPVTGLVGPVKLLGTGAMRCGG
ncbi:TadE family protein [Arthrobacter crystallopoietes]|uniref:TadE family protein n=1 Tax=Crystallibacter crystallopoietes TaxID=37928 RepID=UPI003D1B1972